MKNELLPIQPGTRVRVSNGAPMPPARFTKKMSDWKNHNFDAVVIGEENAAKYGRPEHVYKLQFGDLSKRAWMILLTDRPASQVTALEDAPSYLVEKQGLDAVVVGLIPQGGA